MNLKTIDELYELLESEQEFDLPAEYVSKLVQLAAACSGRHIVSTCREFSLGYDKQKTLIEELAKNIKQSIENYVETRRSGTH